MEGIEGDKRDGGGRIQLGGVGWEGRMSREVYGWECEGYRTQGEVLDRDN